MTPGRWMDYYLTSAFSSFWNERAKDEGVQALVILGLGFDPRCLVALRALACCGLGKRLGYVALKLKSRPSYGDSKRLIDRLAQSNTKGLGDIDGCIPEGVLDLETHDSEGHYIGGRKALLAIAESGILAKYTDIVVDISGMPRGIFFPLVSYLLHEADKGTFRNLHVAVVEDPGLDACIVGGEYGQADYLHTFRRSGENKTVWLPLIGSNETARLEKIHNKLKSSCVEICPIVPFPAGSLRRADEILVRHRDLLFESFLVSQENLILCDESTPFDVYRKIIDVDDYYRSTFVSIPSVGEITTVVSPLSSKTLSLGMLLAAIERTLPVCHVEAGAIQVELHGNTDSVARTDYEPKEVWLAGEPYL